MASTNLPSSADYLIVGGGTAGLVAACRLSENPDISVVVLESGPDRTRDPQVQNPGAWHSLSGSDLDWKLKIVPQVRVPHGLSCNKVELTSVSKPGWPQQPRTRPSSWEGTWWFVCYQWTGIRSSIAGGYRCLGGIGEPGLELEYTAALSPEELHGDIA